MDSDFKNINNIVLIIGTFFGLLLLSSIQSSSDEKEISNPAYYNATKFPTCQLDMASFRFWPAEDYHQKYLEKGAQKANKGCLDPIKCYG